MKTYREEKRHSIVIAMALTFVFAASIVALFGVNTAFAQCSAMVDTVKSTGTQFLLCFEQNDARDRSSIDNGFCEIEIATLDAPTDTITITSRRYPSLKQVFILGPRVSKTWRITDTWPDLWINHADDTLDDRVVKVTASSPIACYGLNHKQNTSDGFLALPDRSCGSEYRIISYGNSIDAFGGDMPSEFAVAAFSDNTVVTITPSAPTSTGRAAGAPFSVTLAAGQSIQVQTQASVAGQDLTGSIVSSTLPVAVFGAHARTETPSGFLSGVGVLSRNTLTEQLPPVGVWGRNFVLSAFQIDATGNMNPEGDLMRIVALNDNTAVTINGRPWTTLMANRYADSLIHGPIVVTATGPVLVGEYAHSSLRQTDEVGDPFLVVIPPIDQSYNDYTFFASDDPAFNFQKVIIATNTAAQSNIQFDGTPLASSIFAPLSTMIGGSSFALTELPITAGSHRLSTTTPAAQAFTIVAYGLGWVDGYGYTAGALMRPLRAVFIQQQPLIAPRHNPIQLHNVLAEQVYLDEADFIPDDPADTRFGIHIAEKLDPINGFLDIGQTSTLHLACDPAWALQLAKPVSGRIKIYSHTYNWHDLDPAEQSWTFYPITSPNGGASAGVARISAAEIGLHNAPNPFGLATTISFSMPETADVSLTLVDELGRVVRNIASGEFPAGPYNIRLDRHDIPSGFYMCELKSQRLGIETKIPIIATE